jgi:hypothetical protein
MDWVLHRVTTPRQTFDVPSNKISLKSIGPPQKYCHNFKDPISSICLKPQVFPQPPAMPGDLQKHSKLRDREEGRRRSSRPRSGED